MNNVVPVAVVQSSPVVLNKKKTLEKVSKLLKEAGKKAELVLFPEAFISAYPRLMTFGTHVGGRTEAGRDSWAEYYENALDVPGPETETLGKLALQYGIFLSIGVIEREIGSLYCTQLFFAPDGQLAGKHRKIKPTGAERYIWAEGDGSTLTTFDTPIGKTGTLICWENYMPLARMSMYMQGVQIYLAPTADQREIWQNSMKHIAVEGRCFVLSANQFVSIEDYPEHIIRREDLHPENPVVSRGGSVILSPFAEVLAGPLYDKEGILYASLDLRETIRGKMDLDVAGHYNRPDIFSFEVDKQPPIRKINARPRNKTKKG